jgi:hypothetical protein
MKNMNKSIENSEVISILKTRTLFVLMIEQTLMKVGMMNTNRIGA